MNDLKHRAPVGKHNQKLPVLQPLVRTVQHDSLKLRNDVLFHLQEPICQGSGKVRHNLWLWWTAACRCAHTENVGVRVQCQSHALLEITAFNAERRLYNTLLMSDITVNGVTQ